MSRSREDLPSIDDLINDDLPSIKDLLAEEDLPSVEDYIEKEEIEEGTETIEDADGNTFAEVQDIVPPWPELVRMINDVRKDIPDIPEVKYYDKELEELSEQISGIKDSIPTVPEWVNGIHDVPDFSWVGKTFSVIDEDFTKINNTVESVREKIDSDLQRLTEDVEKKYFENVVVSEKISFDVKDLGEKIKVKIEEEKDKIWKELSASSLKMWNFHKESKDDDRKLRKQILGEYNSLKQKIKKDLEEVNDKSVKTDELLLKYFSELKDQLAEQISGVRQEIPEMPKIPEVKYYDKEIKDLYEIVRRIKSTQKNLKEETKNLSEGLLNIPPETNNSDPLTPLGQEFVTFKQLSEHYRLFINRIQTQLAAVGGGGIGDAPVDGNSYTRKNGDWVAGLGDWTLDGVGLSTTKSVGIGTTAKEGYSLYVEGDARVTGILTVGQGSITLDPNNKEITGIDEIVVGSGASISLAPLFQNQGKFSVDYSKLTLKGFNSNNEGTYERQSTSFVLATAPTRSGSARFQETSGYYYFLHESDNSKIIIFNIVTGNWDAVHSSGSNFSSPSSGTLVNPPSNVSFITPVRATLDGTGRSYPGPGRGIAYSTVVTEQTSSLGIATASSLEVTGIVTATSFVGPLTGNATGLSGTPNISIGTLTASGNVTIGGTLTYEDVTNIDAVGLSTARSGLQIGNGTATTIVSLEAATSTTTTTSETAVDTFSATVYRSAQYQIQITQGTSYHVTTLNVLHDGSSVYLSEFGTIRNGSVLATFDADVNSGSVRIKATPSSDSSTVFKISKTLTKV
tara:strand:- start:2102 stop:4486 length:2385 start_codon:yes stop_codon:yes gene_type:complete